jgi:hypothetical protein
MNEEKIWKYLYSVFQNAYGTAALMGNLMAESSLNPSCVTGAIKDPDYVKKADAGTIDYVHDGCAFGLVQWCFRTRKEGLLKYAKSKNMSVGSIDLQLEYMCKELKESYKTVYNAIINAKNIKDPSDIIMLKYEKPANTSEKMRQKRADYGKKFYDMFVSGESSEKKEPETSSRMVVVTTDKVNIRAGNGTNFPRITQVNKNAMYEHVATSDNGWYAVKLIGKVGWVSSEFSKLKK